MRSASAAPSLRAGVEVSFIIPLYNCLALTQATVASLQATLPPGLTHEIILVDDGSTDGTRAWLESLRAPFRVVLNNRNLGYAGANNRGAAVASGRLLVLLNSDLVLTRRWLEPMLAAHRALGSRAGFVGNVQRTVATGAVDHAGISINLKAKPEHDHTIPPRWIRLLFPLRRAPAVTGACALIARAVWVQHHGFDEAFVNGGEDVDLCLRLRAAGLRHAVALRSIIGHHVSASPGRKLRDEHNSLRLAQKHGAVLESLAYHRWCWNYLDREWTESHPSADHAAALAVLLYSLRLRRTPPALAVTGMHAAMEVELTRWKEVLG